MTGWLVVVRCMAHIGRRAIQSQPCTFIRALGGPGFILRFTTAGIPVRTYTAETLYVTPEARLAALPCLVSGPGCPSQNVHRVHVKRARRGPRMLIQRSEQVDLQDGNVSGAKVHR